MSGQLDLTPQNLLWAYANGVFPMAEHRRGEVHWYSADPRAILPLHPADAFRVSRSLRRRVRKGEFVIRHDTAFHEVISNCSQPRGYERETWINDQIIDAFTRLHELGFAHSVEAWGTAPNQTCTGAENEEGCGNEGELQLVGGLYGVSLGAAFFGESMFSRATDASKVCLVHLVDRLRRRGYTLLDVQFNSEHMSQFGVIDIPADQYRRQLTEAITETVRWDDPEADKMAPGHPRPDV